MISEYFEPFTELCKVKIYQISDTFDFDWNLSTKPRFMVSIIIFLLNKKNDYGVFIYL